MSKKTKNKNKRIHTTVTIRWGSPAQLLTDQRVAQVLLYDINHNHAEVVACIAAYLSSVSLIYNILPPAQHGSLPAPLAQTPDIRASDANPGGGGHRGQGAHRPGQQGGR